MTHFDGATYDATKDCARLTGQLGRVYHCLQSGTWWTLAELSVQCARLRTDGHWDSDAALSARIRDLRKPKFGGHTVEAKRIAGGLWVYRLRSDAQGELLR